MLTIMHIPQSHSANLEATPRFARGPEGTDARTVRVSPEPCVGGLGSILVRLLVVAVTAASMPVCPASSICSLEARDSGLASLRTQDCPTKNTDEDLCGWSDALH